KTLRNVAVKSGGSLTIPCFYDEQYKSNPKFWCKGKYWRICGVVAYANTSGRTSVTDYPTQNMFTLELNSLQDSDSGYYWCAVEIGDKWTVDDSDYLYLTVSADPAVSVINSRVSGQEGGSVSVQCLYRTDYKNQQKQWCRFRDWRCLTSQNSAVQISDDGRGAVSVEMSGLKKSDAGWYWFSAGEVGVTVHLTVAERPTTKTAVATISSTVKTSISETRSEANQTETTERSSNSAIYTNTTGEDADMCTAVSKKKKTLSEVTLGTDVIYGNVATDATNEPLSPDAGGDEMLYGNILPK
ncbi:polymeric immunoglobulin receptor-like, partial [Hoplias malabaricus]|uniref:polymeric immunoglobulin receptor-like n=1 Tax=Hoplias malabaricus TaxID=27720 RepID=UPI00346332D2